MKKLSLYVLLPLSIAFSTGSYGQQANGIKLGIFEDCRALDSTQMELHLENAIYNIGTEQLINRLFECGVQDLQGKALAAAIKTGNKKLVEELLKRGSQDPHGRALGAAIAAEQYELVDILLAHGAQDPYGVALAAAVELGRDDLVDTLLKHGAQDPSGWARTAAKRKGRDDLVEKIAFQMSSLGERMRDMFYHVAFTKLFDLYSYLNR